MKQDSPAVTEETLEAFFDYDGFLAYGVNDWDTAAAVVGVSSLIVSRKVNGHTARLEHVSVLPDFQGKGIGRRVVEMCIERAKFLNCRYIDLTTEPSREAANALYEKLGFELRETNVRRLILSP